MDVVAEETAPRTFIRRIRAGLLAAIPTKSSENFDGDKPAEKCWQHENEDAIGESEIR